MVGSISDVQIIQNREKNRSFSFSNMSNNREAVNIILLTILIDLY